MLDMLCGHIPKLNFITIVSTLTIVTSAHAAGARMTAAQVDVLPASAPTLVARYGPDRLQFAELRMPRGRGPFPVAIIVHGGCWTRGFAQARNTAPLASALAHDGIATWNIEYRQVGDPGGGWPGTYRDWAAAADALRDVARSQPLDLSRVVAVGHSAGGHAALWLAGRRNLPKDSALRSVGRPLNLVGAVDIDGPADLVEFSGIDASTCGEPVIAPLMGGSPTAVPDRYRQGSPAEMLPLGAHQWLIASTVLRPEAAQAYRRRAMTNGDQVEVAEIHDSGHFELIAPATAPGLAVKATIERALR